MRVRPPAEPRHRSSLMSSNRRLVPRRVRCGRSKSQTSARRSASASSVGWSKASVAGNGMPPIVRAGCAVRRPSANSSPTPSTAVAGDSAVHLPGRSSTVRTCFGSISISADRCRPAGRLSQLDEIASRAPRPARQASRATRDSFPQTASRSGQSCRPFARTPIGQSTSADDRVAFPCGEEPARGLRTARRSLIGIEPRARQAACARPGGRVDEHAALRPRPPGDADDCRTPSRAPFLRKSFEFGIGGRIGALPLPPNRSGGRGAQDDEIERHEPRRRCAGRCAPSTFPRRASPMAVVSRLSTRPFAGMPAAWTMPRRRVARISASRALPIASRQRYRTARPYPCAGHFPARLCGASTCGSARCGRSEVMRRAPRRTSHAAA